MELEPVNRTFRLDLMNRFNDIGWEWSQCMAREVVKLLVPEAEYIAAKQCNAHEFLMEMVAEFSTIANMPGTWTARAEDLWRALTIYHQHSLLSRWLTSGLTAFLDIFVKAMQGAINDMEPEQVEDVIRFMEEYLEPYRSTRVEASASLN